MQWFTKAALLHYAGRTRPTTAHAIPAIISFNSSSIAAYDPEL